MGAAPAPDAGLASLWTAAAAAAAACLLVITAAASAESAAECRLLFAAGLLPGALPSTG